MTMSASTQQRAADNVRRHPCYRAGLTFFEWFWGQTIEPAGSECWEWQGTISHKFGYGQVSVPSVRGGKFTHRVAWQLARGPVPPGLCVLHRCDNPPCVRPSHLFLGTLLDNVRDRDQKGRGYRSMRMRCGKGHRLTPDNLVRFVRGRECRKCRNARARAHYYRLKGATA